MVAIGRSVDEKLLAFCAQHGIDPVNVQGNILRSHRRPVAEHLFLRFGPFVSPAARWLQRLAGTALSTAQPRSTDAVGVDTI
jgi:hypothetical protein